MHAHVVISFKCNCAIFYKVYIYIYIIFMFPKFKIHSKLHVKVIKMSFQ
jgi:hypothetical protein